MYREPATEGSIAKRNSGGALIAALSLQGTPMVEFAVDRKDVFKSRSLEVPYASTLEVYT